MFEPGLDSLFLRKATAVDTPLQRLSLTVERKHFTFDLNENPNGKFLRITEEVSGRYDSIVIPASGLEQFSDALNKTIEFSETLSRKTVKPLPSSPRTPQ
jgi:PurA ssDNA and RNA-binding protein